MMRLILFLFPMGTHGGDTSLLTGKTASRQNYYETFLPLKLVNLTLSKSLILQCKKSIHPNKQKIIKSLHRS